VLVTVSAKFWTGELEIKADKNCCQIVASLNLITRHRSKFGVFSDLFQLRKKTSLDKVEHLQMLMHLIFPSLL